MQQVFLTEAAKAKTIDTLPPITADTLFFVYLGLAVLSGLCIGFIIYLWNKSGKRRNK